jgi:hypothetical protein
MINLVGRTTGDAPSFLWDEADDQLRAVLRSPAEGARAKNGAIASTPPGQAVADVAGKPVEQVPLLVQKEEVLSVNARDGARVCSENHNDAVAVAGF